MTPEDARLFVKDAKRALGLSDNDLARLLRVSDGRTVRRWTAGERDVPGLAIVGLAYMLRYGTKLADEIGFLPDSEPSNK